MRHHLTCTVVGCVAVAIMLLGCDSQPAAPTGPWSVTLATSGGVTGGGGAATIDSDGKWTGNSWETAGDEPVASVTKEVPKQELADLLEAISDPSLQSAPPGQPQNMTTQLSVEMNGKTKEWIDNEDNAALTRAVTAFRAATAAAE